MAWTSYQWFLAVLLVVTGSINTIATKWADSVDTKNSEGKTTKFNHPFFQACGMFLGQLSCLLVFKLILCYTKLSLAPEERGQINILNSGDFNALIFLFPAVLDMTATSLMYIGLNLTSASSFQMLRGAVIIFTGVLSVIFLGRRLLKVEWAGIIVVIIGLVCVGVSDLISQDSSQSVSSNDMIVGDGIIILAQIFVSIQMVYEEKYVAKYNVPPMQGVGWEGLFGFVTLAILLIPMYFIYVGSTFSTNPKGRLEDALDAFVQMSNNWQVATGVSGTIFSIAFFNFAGLSITKEMSATTRVVLDSLRTFIVWIFSLVVGWQTFHYLQLIGFLILMTGMCLYNHVLEPVWEKIRALAD